MSFPTVDEVRDTNRELLVAVGEPDHVALRDLGTVERAILDAREYWAETGDIAGTAARLVAPISKYQPFMDTNHRTAHTIMSRFLLDAGYPHLAPEEDEELAAILERDRDPYAGVGTQVQAITELLAGRLKAAGVEKLVLDKSSTTTRGPGA